jgi:phosphate transport system permease protein
MSLTQDSNALTSDELHDELAGKRLPTWVPWAVAGGAVVLSLIFGLTGIISGIPLIAIVAGLLFVVGETVWSFRVEGRRHATDRFATTIVYTAFVVAVIPLIAILFSVIQKGLTAFNFEFLGATMRNVNARDAGGGVAHALVGTIEQVAMATVIAVPIGILVAIYLVEYGRGRLATSISFFVDVMTGVPSIVAGLFIFTGLILTLGLERSGFAASLALVILMLPVVVRTTEEMIKLVPNDLREASYALGVPKWRTITSIVLPTALPGIITGVMLAVARVAGETAPLLLTTFLSQSMNWDLFNGPQAALPTMIWDQIGSGTDTAIDRAWGAALVLILFVAILYVGARVIAKIYAPKSR